MGGRGRGETDCTARGHPEVLEDTRLVVPPGSVVICGHHTYHRATRKLAGAGWRAMFKLNAARVSDATAGPHTYSDPAAARGAGSSARPAAGPQRCCSWRADGLATLPAHHAAGTPGAAEHHGVWEAVWSWLGGLPPAAPFAPWGSVPALRETLLGPRSSELACVEAGCRCTALTAITAVTRC